MKKMLMFIVAVAILAACSKKEPSENSLDRLNGYDQFLKTGDITKDLRIRGGVVGTVTYGLDLDNAEFYITYVTDDGWELVRTHMFAGKWKEKPKNRRNDRKRFRFPQKTTHDPYVNTYTYTIPLVNLPPYDEPGFIVAAHAKVYNSAKCGDSDYKHAWADWDRRFRCSGWGGYSRYFYNEPYEPHTNYYSVDYDAGDLNIYLVDATENVSETIFTESGVGLPTTDDGASIDPATGYIYFTKYNETTNNELLVNVMDEEDSPSYSLGEIVGTPLSVTYYDNTVYYTSETVDVDNNPVIEIRKVTIVLDEEFDELYIESDQYLATIPTTFTAINDIVIQPSETGNLYLVGSIGDAPAELIEYDISEDDYFNTLIADGTVDFSLNPQIAFDDSGELYLIQGSIDGGGDLVSTISPLTGEVIDTVEDDLECIPPFCDDTFGMLGTISIN